MRSSAVFVDVGLVDDASFAAALVQTRSTVAGRGRHRIRQNSSQGVDREVAEAAMSDIDPDEELTAAIEVARKRARSLAGLEPHVVRRRLAGVLARRGFPGHVVSQALASALSNSDDDSVEFSTGEQ